jgi:hypothetical protein
MARRAKPFALVRRLPRGYVQARGSGRQRPDIRYATVPTCVASTRTLPERAAWRSNLRADSLA